MHGARRLAMEQLPAADRVLAPGARATRVSHRTHAVPRTPGAPQALPLDRGHPALDEGGTPSLRNLQPQPTPGRLIPPRRQPVDRPPCTPPAGVQSPAHGGKLPRTGCPRSRGKPPAGSFGDAVSNPLIDRFTLSPERKRPRQKTPRNGPRSEGNMLPSPHRPPNPRSAPSAPLGPRASCPRRGRHALAPNPPVTTGAGPPHASSPSTR